MPDGLGELLEIDVRILVNQQVPEADRASEARRETPVQCAVRCQHGKGVAGIIGRQPTPIRDHVVRQVDADLDRHLEPAFDGRANEGAGFEPPGVAGELAVDLLQRVAQDEQAPGDDVTIDQ